MRSLLIFAMIFSVLMIGCGPESADQMSNENQDDPASQAPETVYHAAKDVGDEESPFPRLPPVGHLRVLDARVQTRAMQYLLTSLQGVVNRSEPRIYLLLTPFNHPDPAEHEMFWLEEMEEYFGVTYEMVDDPWTLLAMFADEIKGVIVIDPNLPNSRNVGTILAGIEDSIMVDPELLDQVLAMGFPIVEDLRGRFASTTEMYEWAFAELWPYCRHDILAYVDQQFTTLRDYLVAQKIFTLGLDPHRKEEYDLLDYIYAHTPENISVLGWVVDEVIGVQLLTRNSKWHNASDLVPNLSVQAGLIPIVPEIPQKPAPPPLENKIYLAFGYGDGDNASFMHRDMLNRWNDPARGQIPLGWEFNTTLIDLSPAVYRYYRSTISANDAIIGPVVGIGYMYPHKYPDLDRFLEITNAQYRRHGYKNIWVINDNLTMGDEILMKYSQALDIDGFFLDYWPNADRGWHVIPDGTPAVRSQYVYLVGAEQIPNILANAEAQKEFHYPNQPTFTYIGVNAWGTPPTLVKEIIDGLDDRYRVVRPDILLDLVREALN